MLKESVCVYHKNENYHLIFSFVIVNIQPTHLHNKLICYSEVVAQ